MNLDRNSAPLLKSCPACRSGSGVFFRQVPDHEYGLSIEARFFRCQSCGTLFQEPMPSDRALESYYPKTYHSFTGHNLLSELRHQSRLRRLETLADRAEGPWLDFGCGSGSFLDYTTRFPSLRSYYGYEISGQNRIEERKPGKLVIITGSLDFLIENLPACGVITMNHVIEHLPRPAETLARLITRLHPGGVIEGQTPSADSWEHAFFGGAWSGYHAPRHTVIFTPRGIEALFSDMDCQAAVEPGFNPAGYAVSLGSMLHGNRKGSIARQGVSWLAWLSIAFPLAMVETWVGKAGIINFCARRAAREPENTT